MQNLYLKKNDKRTGRKPIGLFSLFFFFLGISAFQASAQNYSVTDPTDGHAANQLRGAIEAADLAGGSHIINVAAGTYNLTLGTITFGSNAQNITIVGTGGAAATIINMTTTNQDRIFLINTTGTINGVQTTLQGLTFKGGHLKSDMFGGGAILAGGPANSLTITNCTFDNNTIDATAGTTGGAINMAGGGVLNISGSNFTNNTNPTGDGGAVFYFLQNVTGLTGSISITNCTFSNNSASIGSGGAIGLAPQGATTGQTFSASIQKNTFVNNTAPSGAGGAIIADNAFGPTGIVSINYNRFTGNTASATYSATSALGMNSASGSVDATNNWWGCNGGPTSCADKAAVVGSGGTGTLTAAPYLQLKATASPSSICPGGTTTTVTASFLSNSAGTAMSTSNLGTLIGQPISFTSVLGTLSGAQTTIQANGTATVTFTSGAASGAASVNGVVDNIPNNDATAKAAITVYATGTWTGAVSTSWLNPANWNCSILPTATTDVTIPSGTPRMPVVDGAGAVANNVTVNSGATLGFSGNNLLEVKGTITATGTFNPANGSLKLSGTAAQTLPAGTYYDLFIEGGGAKTMAGNVTVAHTLTLTSGNVIVGTNTLALNAAATISGGSSGAYILTGSTGKLLQNGLGATGRTGTILFPVGTAINYTPLSINNAGTTDNFDVRVIDNVYARYTGETPNSAAETSNAVKKTWFINEAVAGGSNVTLTFQWNSADEAAGFLRASAFASHYSATLNYWQKFPQAGATGSGPYVLSQTGITTFSPFGIGSGATVLPLKLVSFTGKRVQQNTYLSWQTMQEVNVEKFIVERAVNNNPFSPVGEVAAANAAGEQNYSFTDLSLAAASWNTVQYRLQIVDRDGRTEQSRVVQFTNQDRRSSVTVTNPFSQFLPVTVYAAQSGAGTITLYDLNGKKLLQKTITLRSGTNSIQLNTSSVSQGTYLLKAEWNGEFFTEKVIKLNN